MDDAELREGQWAKFLDTNSLLDVEQLVRKEVDARKAEANACFGRERKVHIPYIGSLGFAMTWGTIAATLVMVGMLGLLGPPQLFGSMSIIYMSAGVAMLIPMRYFAKRYNAFLARFKERFPSEARLIGWM